MSDNTIKISVLAALLDRIADHYAERGMLELDTGPHDAYRAVATDEMFDVYTESDGPLPIGSLDDDLTELEKLLTDRDRAVTALDLERLGNVLRAASEILVD